MVLGRLLVVTSKKVETTTLKADKDGIVRLELPVEFKTLEIQ